MSQTENFIHLLDRVIRARLSNDVVPLEQLVTLEDAFNDAVEARVQMALVEDRRP